MKNKLLLLLLVLVNNVTAQDTIISLWPKGKIPNHIESQEKELHEQNEILRISKVQVPTIEVYLPSKRDATGEAVLIFPGGGYGILAYDWEGTDIAKFFNSKGIAGIVVKYRLPSDVSQKDKKYVPLIDAQRAIRLVRSNAEQFNLKSNKIGIIGFSAGGHLASTLGTHFNEKVYKAVDDIDNESARPDFMALGYPVISFGELTHQGSKRNLIGKNASIHIVDYFSNEKQVTEQTPPTFLLHATDDTVVPVENSLLFYKAVKEKGVSATMHIYPKGGHGFGLGLHDEHLKDWSDLLIDWMVSLR
ncbi:acetyl esterase/lipase [Maribacter spongiicola]|uniref:Acetyl esterase/lipase n=1 Tax=Maribacter spongiicola TaxID=1206753 RepID=A0A4V3EQ53_9FLAO|nr:alpha/beta hydrolase [Maribacter spongiicola]TDT40468.1 acetyl esterase/lipase [Maribacter spongiicola]